MTTTIGQLAAIQIIEDIAEAQTERDLWDVQSRARAFLASGGAAGLRTVALELAAASRGPSLTGGEFDRAEQFREWKEGARSPLTREDEDEISAAVADARREGIEAAAEAAGDSLGDGADDCCGRAIDRAIETIRALATLEAPQAAAPTVRLDLLDVDLLGASLALRVHPPDTAGALRGLDSARDRLRAAAPACHCVRGPASVVPSQSCPVHGWKVTPRNG